MTRSAGNPVASQVSDLTPSEYAAISLLVLDVDGVMTDGSIFLDDNGNETKRYHVRDGFGIKLWQKLGFEIAIITGRSGRSIEHRAHELKIEHVIQGSKDKGVDLAALAARLNRGLDRVAYLGDDWPDLPAMARAQYPMAVADAHDEVRRIARFITTKPGGHGAVREAVEHLLDRMNLLEKARSLYT
jgi:3-deoxy-D-manno-octulosonate 8-phosphate phosphatase (KDO 8-P phosphatase)